MLSHFARTDFTCPTEQLGFSYMEEEDDEDYWARPPQRKDKKYDGDMFDSSGLPGWVAELTTGKPAHDVYQPQIRPSSDV